MLQADAYFMASKYTEAIVAYEDFLRRNPTDSKVPFAAFRIASAYDKQSPEAKDREQYFAIKALEKYANFIEIHKDSSYFSEAKERFSVLKRRFADHNLFVADFYFRRESFQAALGRYLSLEKAYPEYTDILSKSRAQTSLCYEKLALELEADPKSDLKRIFLDTTPDKLREEAKKYALKATAK